ncbi:methylated-DNA-protein-cysteine methyltransferase [Histoplasma capsulatum var. duboisii H88]|uniref:Methylated-DNA-protein-cysteine methyltransferase n=1 Tax=Ajellomyces capsulatus (strain H88) TaxID=544711 RepID=F0USI9_AJEC8|nr:methylated-DNA-protein-cysteine methyltransferase [Histoplasma capsulatum var. duboisii H88]
MAVATTSSSTRWRAIVNRDATANDFVYGVRTTKIYCRPRCPARLARRANVEFYDTPKQAEKAGYRPCKRCKPEDLRAPPDPHIKLAQRACQTMTLAALRAASGTKSGEARARPTLQDLANEAGLTPSHFHRVFKKVVGITPGRFGRDVMEGKKMTPTVGGMRDTEVARELVARARERGAEKADANGNGKSSVDFPSKVGGDAGAAVTGLGLDGVDDVLSAIATPDPQNYTVLPDAVPIRIDWNEFDRMLGSTGGGDAGRNSNNDHSNGRRHPHHLPHNHNSDFPTGKQQQLQTQSETQRQSPITTAAPLHPHILDPNSINSAELLLDHYEFPWETPDCTFNFSSPPLRHTTTASGDADSNGSLPPYIYDPLIDTNSEFYSKFIHHNSTTNRNCNINYNNCSNTDNGLKQQQQQHPLHLLDLSEDSSSLTTIDTPPFLVESLHATGFSSGESSASSTHASPLLFEDVDWYGSPSIFQTYA